MVINWDDIVHPEKKSTCVDIKIVASSTWNMHETNNTTRLEVSMKNGLEHAI
jgi:hypothetical protein